MAREVRQRTKDEVRRHVLRSVELFAGAGGLALGLGRAGFSPALVVERDKHACETLRQNGESSRSYTADWPVESKDIRKISYQGLPPIDLLSAGAPCQPFSQAGLGRGQHDHRDMFGEVLRAVREIQPRAFLIENVRGLLFKRSREYFDFLIAQLRVPSRHASRFWSRENFLATVNGLDVDEHEYLVEWKLLNAADFGLPQHRVRLVIIGIQQGVRGSWSWPQATHSRSALVAALKKDAYWQSHGVPARVRKEVRASLPRDDGPKRKRWRTLRDLTARLGDPHDGRNGGDPAHVLVPGARLYEKHTGSRLDWPGKTVKAGVHGPPGGEHIVIRDDGSHRYLTVRECASLQGFPNDYWLPETRVRAMRQIGNAVPVSLAESLGARIVEVLKA